jgi:hypothetical protein
MGVSLDIIKNEEGKILLDNFKAKLLYRYKNFNDNSFRVLLFQDLNNEYLRNYEEYFSKKEELIKYYGFDMEVS